MVLDASLDDSLELSLALSSLVSAPVVLKLVAVELSSSVPDSPQALSASKEAKVKAKVEQAGTKRCGEVMGRGYPRWSEWTVNRAQ